MAIDRGRGSEEEESGRGVLRSSGPEDRGWEVLRSSDPEDRKTSLFLKNFHIIEEGAPLPSSVRSSTHSSRPKIEDGGWSSIFGAEDRKLKMGGVLRFTAPNIEDGGSSIFELRRSKNLPTYDLRSRKIEEPLIFDLRSRRSKNLSIFVFLPRRSKNPPSSFF